MRGYYATANGSFTDTTSCSSEFSPAATVQLQPRHILPLPVTTLQFGKRIPTEFCTFTVLRPSRVFYPNGRPPQVRKIIFIFAFSQTRGVNESTVREYVEISLHFGSLIRTKRPRYVR